MRKKILQQILKEKPLGNLVKNKYLVISGVIQRMYPQFESMPQNKLADILYDAIALDREWRMETEGLDKDTKERLEQEWIIKNYK